MRKVLKDVTVTLLNPISPIVTLIVSFLLSILLVNSQENLPSIISVLISNPSIVLAFLILWLAVTVLYSILYSQIQEYKIQLDKKDALIQEKENQLAHTAGIVLERTGDFANFSKILAFTDVLKGFTENNTIVECAQIYKYCTKRVNNSVIIRVTYDNCYCSDGIDINNLAQCYYDIDYNDYIQLKYLIKIYKKLSSDDDYYSFQEKDSMKQELVTNINEIFNKYYASIKKIEKISEINSQHFTQYRILTLLARIARRQTTTMFERNIMLGKEKAEIENYLLNGKRTGILNSIILEDIFMFKYTRNSHKKDGRAYIAFPINIYRQNYICVFSIQSLDLDPNIDLEHEIKSLREDLVERFSKI